MESNKILYKLKESVTISEFDCVEQDRYLLSYNNRNWNISKEMKLIIENINICNSFDEVKDRIEDNYKLDISLNLIKSVYRDFLLKNKLMQGLDEEDSDNIYAKNELLWARFTIIPENIVKNMKFMKCLFTKRFVMFNIMFFIFINAVAIYKYRTNLTVDTITLIKGYGVIYFILINAVVTLFHEIGHAVASLKYDVIPKRIGGAVYLSKPVMFTDVSSIWKLTKKQRQVVNFGGVYFQIIMSSVIVLYFLINKDLQNLNITIMSELLILSNFNVFIKSDGYWIMSDYLGISNFHDLIVKKINRIFKSKSKSKIEFNKKMNTALNIYLLIFSITIIFIGYVLLENVKATIYNIIAILSSGINLINIFSFIYSIILLVLVIVCIINVVKKISRIYKRSNYV